MIMPKHISRKQGFTLIELLIVIGILGILAAGLLAAIDPLEQLKRGRDTQKRNVAVEVDNAFLRFYSIQGSMPWGTVAYATTLAGAIADGSIASLTSSGELKSTFTSAVANYDDQMWVLGEANGESLYVCLRPESKSIRMDPATIYTNVTQAPPGTGVGCPGITALCYFCVR